MLQIGRGMSRDVQTKVVYAKKKYFQEIPEYFSPLKAFNEIP